MIEISTHIKIAVAGCGSAGRHDIREFMKTDEVEIVACCDSEEAIARFTSKEFGIPSYYTDIAGMLDAESVDALIVAVPDGEHLRAASEALNRGVHVFCENPLASSYAEAVEMTRMARESGLIAVVNRTALDTPLMRSAVKYVKTGSLGRIRYFEASFMQNRLDSAVLDDPYEEKRLIWRLSSAAGSGGAIGELGSVLFELAAAVCGDPAEVSAMISNIGGFDEIDEYRELELNAGDTFICQLGFAGGAAGVVRGSWMSGGPYEQLTMAVFGDNGMIKLDTAESENEFNLITAESSVKIPADRTETGIYDNFISAVKGEAAAESGFDENLKMQYFIEQSRLSADGGLRLEFDYL